jgi:hypothetical protein
MDTKKRGGWPARTPEPGERVPMSFRVTPDFKAMLDQAAAQSGRSLAQEIELRLVHSFRDQRIVESTMALAYGERLAAILLTIGTVLKDGGPTWGIIATREHGIDWLNNAYAYDQAVKATAHLLEAFRPVGDPAPPPVANEKIQFVWENAGKAWANGALAVIAGVPGYDLYERALAPIKGMLGPLAEAARKFLMQIGLLDSERGAANAAVVGTITVTMGETNG